VDAARGRGRKGEEKMLKKLGLLAVLAVALTVGPARSEALSVVDAFLFSDWSAPTVGSSPPFAFTPTDGVSLTLNGSKVATSFSDVGSEGPFWIYPALTYSSHTGTVNPGESGGTTASHINNEIQVLDDVGVFNEAGGDDALLNLDYAGAGASVTFAIPQLGAYRLMIGEDAGLDPFMLELCSDAVCTSPELLFNGFDSTTLSGILERSDFDSGDGAAIDQIYLFNFGEPAYGYFRITNTTNPGGTPLEIDIVAVAQTEPPPPVIPEPASMLLFGLSGIGALAFRRRRS
jgi:hypothetical protein